MITIDNNTLIAIIFAVGTISVIILKFNIHKYLVSWDGKAPETPIKDFNINEALLTNSILTGLMFLMILVYDGCTLTAEMDARIKYEHIDKYLDDLEKDARKRGEYDAMQDIKDAINSPD